MKCSGHRRGVAAQRGRFLSVGLLVVTSVLGLTLGFPLESARADVCESNESLRATAPTVSELVALADCYQSSGRAVRALDHLNAALALAGAADLTAIQGRIAQLYAALGDYEAALAELLRALEQAEAAGAAARAASLLNDLGSVYAATGEALPAIAAFSDAARLAAPGSILRLIAELNANRALWESDAAPAPTVLARLEKLENDAAGFEDSAELVSVLLGLGELGREIAASATASGAPLRRRSYEVLARALDAARALGDQRRLSFAYGYLGRVYEDAGDFESSLSLTRRAVNAAQQAGANDSLYRWEWQLGRLGSRTGRRADAIAAYTAAIETLERLGPTAIVSQRHFAREIAPLYNEYADLVLASTAGLAPDQARSALLGVQAALEQLRLAEVQNYFANQCVIPEAFDVDRSPDNDVVVIYPIAFENRLELLVSSGSELRQVTVDVTAAALTRDIRALRTAIENAAAESVYLPRAQRLYDLLIAPLEAVLEPAAAATLVIVPDGPLRTVPFAALHDGRTFLIERHAVSVTPGLALIGAQDAPRSPSRVLANGIIEPVQGFSALPYVAEELASIEQVFPARTYTDEAFRVASVRDEILDGAYSIVHMATHAQFAADFRNSFLLSYDGLITMDELEEMMGIQRFTDRPVDLLVLSACQTAAGDDRAALGLAGVAVKAGARSALATLWLIDDESTSLLVGEFYRQLATGATAKAEALRGAQLRLINDEAYAHPTYWAPFLLIGDWR